jgi:RNA polymerase sigma-70 factor, ECF subfamily
MKSQTDSTDFLLMYSKLKQPVYNYVHKMIRDKQQCEDIVQNTFLKLFANMSSIRRKESIPQWVFRSARNDVYQYFRTKRTHVDRFNVADVEEIHEASPENPESQYELLNIKEVVNKELDKLPIEQRDVFLLREYDCLSYREIAELLDTEEELVKSRLHKARTKLIAQLKKIIILNG